VAPFLPCRLARAGPCSRSSRRGTSSSSILDLERLDGLLTLEIVRVTSEDLPVVLISAVVSAAIHQKARHLGAIAVLRKPFRNSELLDVLARACRAENGAKGV